LSNTQQLSFWRREFPRRLVRERLWLTGFSNCLISKTHRRYPMTNVQKERIARLRKSGESYAVIAVTLGLSENTVQSYCRRNGLGMASTDKDSRAGVERACAHCGKHLGKSRQRTKRFCSGTCRLSWWKMHPDSLNRKAIYHFICAQCGTPFDSYGNIHRKYCSRACYAKAKTTVIRSTETCP